MNIVLLGIQGSGKGTQAKIMAEKYNMIIFEAGGECRRLAAEDSEIGHKVQAIVNSGNLVPSNVIMEILDSFLSKTPADQNVIFDGIPRSPDQKIVFDNVLKKWNRDFMVIKIQLPKDETIKRLLARGRHDDTHEIISNRHNIFLNDTTPVIETYRSENKLIPINGHQSIEEVAAEVALRLDPYFLKQ